MGSHSSSEHIKSVLFVNQLYGNNIAFFSNNQNLFYSIGLAEVLHGVNGNLQRFLGSCFIATTFYK